MEDSDLSMPDVDAYLRYAQLLKKKAVSKSLSDLGFAPIRYPWNRLGKVQGLRAIVPSSQPYDDLLKTASAPRNRRKPGVKKTQSPPVLPPDFKYAWDLEGHKVLAATYQAFTPSEFNQNRPKSARAEDNGTKKSTSVIPERLIEKTDQAVKKHLEEVARERLAQKVWSPSVYPSSTFATSKNADVLPIKAIHSWPDYEHIGPNEVLVTIEHCTNCAHHKLNTHHKEEHYIKMATAVQMCLEDAVQQFPVRFSVVLKPISLEAHIHPPERAQELLEEHTFHAFKVTSDIIETVSTSLRTGAFEVQVAFRDPQRHVVVHLLHSKLFRGEWPKKRILVNKFVKLLSRVGRFGFHSKTLHDEKIVDPLSNEGQDSIKDDTSDAGSGDNADAVGLSQQTRNDIAHEVQNQKESKQFSPKTPANTSPKSTHETQPNPGLEHPVSTNVGSKPKSVVGTSALTSMEPTVTTEDQLPPMITTTRTVSTDEENIISAALLSVAPQNLVPESLQDAIMSPTMPLTSSLSLNASWIEGNAVDIGSLIFEGSLESSQTVHVAESSVGSGDGVDDLTKFLTTAKSEDAERRNTIANIKSRSQSGGDVLISSVGTTEHDVPIIFQNYQHGNSTNGFQKLATFDDDVDLNQIDGDDDVDADFDNLYDQLAIDC